ncbi:hypothetical protein WR25_19343 isoform B [Diploscapter pachys]|uniref:C-type lectin domain-containing protein n=1 Tax=Diploscapter pachys TaxID=2018661 RepID=A0A2A2K2J6_9BILA|nr:hypothetical protein WR25_19343 isoform B [Diploscapter pachys]
MEFDAAREVCIGLHYDLVTVTDLFNNNFLTLKALNEYNNLALNLWIGYEQVGDSWQWTDGSPNGYTHWAPGEPTQLGVPEAATIRLVDGQWVPMDNQTRLEFICSPPLGRGLS